VVGARQGKAQLPDRIVAIHRLEHLSAMRENEGVLRIGALTTHGELAGDATIRARLAALADACSIVGSHATRAQGTIGGNLMNASPAMETGGRCFASMPPPGFRVPMASARLRSTSWSPDRGGRRRRSTNRSRRSRCGSLRRGRELLRASRIPAPDGDRCRGCDGCR
jgi:hypothetical protein